MVNGDLQHYPMQCEHTVSLVDEVKNAHTHVMRVI